MHVAFDTPGEQLHPCQFPALVEGGLTVINQGRIFAAGPSGELAALPAAYVSSAHAAPVTLYRTSRLQCMGVRLHPAGTLALLQSSPLALSQRVADAADVFGAAWAGIMARINATAAPSDKLALLFQFAGKRLCHDTHLERVRRAYLLQQAAMRRVDAPEATGLGVRQFERVFTGTFGLTPKLFQRVARVEGLLRDALGNARAGAELALHHGFYDQSHMARDVRLLAGAPLRTLIEEVRKPDSPHWALAVGTSALQAG